MKKQYVITSKSNNQKVYFNNEFACFTCKFKTIYTSKTANYGLEYAKKCANTQEILDNLKIEEC